MKRREPLPPQALEDPFARRALTVAYHLRHYLPLYVFGTIFALLLALFPTVDALRDDGGSTAATTGGFQGDTSGAGAAPNTVTGGESLATGPGTAVAGSAPSAAGGASTGGAVAAGAASASTAPVQQAASGVTRGGFDCQPGVRQLPFSTYAPPCVPKFEGDNGGATYRGVTAEEIKIVVRHQADASGPNARAVDEANRAAGSADRGSALEIAKTYTELFNNTFELYGRKVVYVDYEGTGIGTEEAQSKGREAACADATAIADDVKGFGVILYTTAQIESEPFSACAAKKQLFVPNGAAYFPEKYFREWDPYVWNRVMECERITGDLAEYIGKRLLNRPARWAGDPVFQKQDRVFGTYVPDNDGYQHCVRMFEQKLKDEYGGSIKHRVNYQLDVSRFPDQAANAVVQFKAAGVTTLINACDQISTIFLTQAADSQRWYPEWLIIGVAAQDTDGNGRLFSQNQVDGHLFGMSQLGRDKDINSKEGEAYKAWKMVRPDAEPPPGFGLVYYGVLDMFTKLQVAGPTLNPQNVAAGMHALPDGGGATGAFGTWSYKDDHTGIDDSREVYWVGDAVGYDGKEGTYVETYGGKRFRQGQWPADEPPIYPES
jgi:hypothetical protein